MAIQNGSLYLSGISLEDLEAIISNTIRKEMQTQLQALPQQKEVKNEELMSKKEAAAFLKMSLPTISKLVREGIIPCSKIGGNIRFKKSHLEKSLKQTRNRNYRLPGSNSS